jgi:hypothetical protein
MPLPAILGASAIAGFFTSLITKIFDFFIQRSLIAYIQAAALIALVIVVVNTALTSISGYLADILSQLPQWPVELVPLFFPAAVAKNCLLIVITAELIVTYSMWSVWLYKLGKKSFKR